MKALLFCGILLGWGLFPARAEFIPPFSVPLDEMRQSLRELRQQDPDNVELIYRMGRLSYLAYDMGVEAGFTFHPDEPGKSLPSDAHVRGRVEHVRRKAEEAGPGESIQLRKDHGPAEWSVRVMTPEDRVHEALQAYMRLSSAHRKDPEQGLYALTLGSFIRSWLEQDPELKKKAGETALASMNRQDALRAFEAAWRLSRKEDLKREHLPLEGRSGLVSAEAATAWLELAPRGGGSRKTAAKMRKDLARLSTLSFGPVTPLVFFPDGTEKRQVPVDVEARVEFDLAGDGSGGTWTWLREGAVILVWDPEESGQVTSGHQLFGGYTWQMFWKHGFEALAMLDADRDGVLRGNELNGLGGWTDREPLGVSDPGEVVPLDKMGVEILRLKALRYPGAHALVWNPIGMEMMGGETLPVWDWLAGPAD